MGDWERAEVFDDDGLSHRPEFVNSVYYQTTLDNGLEGGYILTARGEVYERIRIHVAETTHDQTYFLDGRLLVWERDDGVYVKFVWNDLPTEDPSILR